MHLRSLALTVLVSVGVAGTAIAQEPKLIAKNSDWEARSYQDAKGKVCYAVSAPKQMAPSDRNHGEVFFFVSTRPGQGVSNEPSLIVGYPFQDSSQVSVDVDGKSFAMFTKGDGAWMENPAEEARLVGAMKAGRSMKVSGTSSRGTNTSYTYSLSGITATLNAVAGACK